jgi:hypothetical protein
MVAMMTVCGLAAERLVHAVVAEEEAAAHIVRAACSLVGKKQVPQTRRPHVVHSQ